MSAPIVRSGEVATPRGGAFLNLSLMIGKPTFVISTRRQVLGIPLGNTPSMDWSRILWTVCVRWQNNKIRHCEQLWSRKNSQESQMNKLRPLHKAPERYYDLLSVWKITIGYLSKMTRIGYTSFSKLICQDLIPPRKIKCSPWKRNSRHK